MPYEHITSSMIDSKYNLRISILKSLFADIPENVIYYQGLQIQFGSSYLRQFPNIVFFLLFLHRPLHQLPSLSAVKLSVNPNGPELQNLTVATNLLSVTFIIFSIFWFSSQKGKAPNSLHWNPACRDNLIKYSSNV